MSRMEKLWSFPRLPSGAVIVTLGLSATLCTGIGVGVVLSYYLHKDESQEKQQQLSDQDSTVRGSSKVALHSLRLLIPTEAVGDVIGPNGSVLKDIEAETGASLRFDRDTRRNGEDWDREEPTDNVAKGRWLTIRGRDAYAVDAADVAVRRLAFCVDPPLRCVLPVPQSAVGVIIGREGQSIKEIRRASGAKLTVGRDTTRTEAGRTVVDITVQGSPSSIDIAKGLLADKVLFAEERDRERRFFESKESWDDS